MSHAPNAYAGLLGALSQDTWGPDAACIGHAQILENPDLEAEAKKLCLGDGNSRPRCPVINDCYRWVMPLTRHQDPGGTRAGMTEDERHAKRRHFAALQKIPQKRCPKCEDVKPVTAFYQNKSKGDGLSSYCRSCDTERREARQLRKAVGQ